MIYPCATVSESQLVLPPDSPADEDSREQSVPPNSPADEGVREQSAPPNPPADDGASEQGKRIFSSVTFALSLSNVVQTHPQTNPQRLIVK